MHINGFDIICDPPRKVIKKVKRSWKERCFTLPFTPLTKYKEVIEWVDLLQDGQIIRSGNQLICSMKTYEKIRTQGL